MKTEILIRIHRNEKDVGYFTQEMALEHLRSGVLRPDDWAYCDGLLDWTPLGELLAFTDVPTSASLPPPLPPPLVLAAMPPALPTREEPPKRKSPVVALVASGAAVCFLGLFFLEVLIGSRPPPSSSTYTPAPRFETESLGQRNDGLLPPLKDFDVNAEPIEAVPELGMSKADVADFRKWMAAGAPRYWRGRDQFPEMSQEEWKQWRKATRETLDRQRQ